MVSERARGRVNIQKKIINFSSVIRHNDKRATERQLYVFRGILQLKATNTCSEGGRINLLRIRSVKLYYCHAAAATENNLIKLTHTLTLAFIILALPIK